MDKLKNILSPGHKEDDTSSSTKQDTSKTGNLAGDTTHTAKNTPGSSHPKPGDDPSTVSGHMPGAFANTPRDELSSSAGGLGGSHTAGTSSTAHHTANPAHSTTAAPASAVAAAGSVPTHGGVTGHSSTGTSSTAHHSVNPAHSTTAAPASAAAAAGSTPAHSSTTGHSSTHPPHATTAAPASAAAAAGSRPTHTGIASDDASTSSIKSGVKGGQSSSPLAPASTTTTHAGHGSAANVGSTAVHTTRETIGTSEGASTVRSTTTTQLAPDGTPLQSHTHRERETVPHHGSSVGHAPGHSSAAPTSGATGIATVPAPAAGTGITGTGHHPQDPSFSNRTLGHDHYGSLDPTTTATGVSSLGSLGRDAGSGIGTDQGTHASSRPHGPHQDTHPLQPGTGAGVGGAGPASHTTVLPDRSRAGINERGTQATVGETSTYSSFPVGGQQVSGPHQTATANILDPHVPQPGIASGTGASPSSHQAHSTHHGTAATGTVGAAAVGAGALSAHERSKDLHPDQGTFGQAMTTDTPSKHGATGIPAGHQGQQTAPEAAAQKSLTGDHSHGSAQKPTDHRSTTAAMTPGQHDQQARQHPAETGSQSAQAGDQTMHHTSRDAPSGASATSGTGHIPLAGTTEGRKAELGEHVDKGPASKTIGPHSSNVLNVLDPRVKMDPAVQSSAKTHEMDPRVEGAGGAAGSRTSADKHHEHDSRKTTDHGATSGSRGTDRHTSSETHKEGTGHTPTSESQRLSSDPGAHGDTTAKGSHGHSSGMEGAEHDSSGGHDTGRHGISALLHRDNPSKLHKDPPSK